MIFLKVMSIQMSQEMLQVVGVFLWVSCLTRYGPKKIGEQSDIHDIVEMGLCCGFKI